MFESFPHTSGSDQFRVVGRFFMIFNATFLLLATSLSSMTEVAGLVDMVAA